MGLERPHLRDQPSPDAFRLHLFGQLARRVCAFSDLEPDDPDQAPPLESPDLAQLELETREVALSQPVRNAFNN
jgi:hypothetical protein